MKFSEEKFNNLMSGQGLENLTENLKEVYIVRHRLLDEKEATLVEEFDTKGEMDEWIDDSGRAILEEHGGKFEFERGPSERERLERMAGPMDYIVKIKYPDPDRPVIQKFPTKEKRREWYKTIGKEFEEVGGVSIEFDEMPAEKPEK